MIDEYHTPGPRYTDHLCHESGIIWNVMQNGVRRDKIECPIRNWLKITTIQRHGLKPSRRSKAAGRFIEQLC